MPQIEAVIFDVDGTLIDSVDFHALAWQRAFEKFGREIPFEKVRAQIGKGGDQLMPVFFSRAELKKFGKSMEEFRVEIFKRDYLPKVKPFPRVRELIERILETGRKIVLASSAKEEEVEAYKKIARIDDLIKRQTSSVDAERSKPCPHIFLAAIEKVGLKNKPESAIVIGDSPYDAEAARSAKLRTIGVLCGGFPEADLRAAGCEWIYRDPADLLKNFDSSPLQ